MCADGRRGSHPQSDCGRKVLLSSLQRMCMLRQVSEQQAQCCVEAQMGSDFKRGLIRHFRPLLVLLEDWPDFQMYQAINYPLLISMGTSQPSVHQKNWAGYLETFIWFSNLYSGLVLFVFCFFYFFNCWNRLCFPLLHMIFICFCLLCK